MKIIKDSSKKEWKLNITIGKLKQVRDELGIDFLDYSRESKEPPAIARMADDIMLCADVITSFIEPVDTGASDPLELDDETLEIVTIAFYEDLENFFHRWRPDHAAAIRKALAIIKEEVNKAAKKIELMNTTNMPTGGNTYMNALE